MSQSQMPHSFGHQTLPDRTLRGALGAIDDMLVSAQNEFRSDGQRLSSFRPMLPPGTSSGFSGISGMTFTVTTDPTTGLITYRYLMITQELMFVDVYVRGTIGGTVSNTVLLPLPVGFTIAGTPSHTPGRVLNGGVNSVGVLALDPDTPTFIRALKTVDNSIFVVGDTFIVGQVLVNVTPLS